MADISRFDGDWENTQGQAFCIQDGVVTMGTVTQQILVEGDNFRLDKDTWSMPRSSEEVVWTKGKYTVKWCMIAQPDHQTPDQISDLDFKKSETATKYGNLSNLMEKSKKSLDDDIALLDEDSEEEVEAAPIGVKVTSVSGKLHAGEIVPDVLKEACDGMVTVAHGENIVTEGIATLTPTQTKDMPTVSWNGEENSLYTVIMTDPDAISRQNPLFREFVHYAAVNVTGSEITADSGVNVALQYAGPGPPYNSGLHRYCWLVYSQSGEVNAEELSTYLEGRGGKKVDSWCTDHGMTLVAANYYEAEWDAHCDESHQKLGFSPPMPYKSPNQQIEAASNKLKTGEVVPDVLADASCGLATVTYGDTTIGMDTGVLTPTQTKGMPTVSWDGSAETLYTVIMTDPDAISRQNPLFREFVHYAAVNVTGSEITADSDVNVALQYAGPGPPYNSGLHRYCWLVYSQEGEVDASELSTYLEGRGGKKVDGWCLDKGMTLVAGNYYEAEWDEHCDEGHKQLGFVPPMPYQSPSQQMEAASAKLKAGEVVPDVLADAACGLVTVTHGDNSVGVDTAVLTPTQTKDMPTVSWNGSADTLYTVIMTDPDAISRENPLFREFVHYAAVNVTGSEITADSDVNVALQYAGPGPPYNSGLHRYCWLVYSQEGEVDASGLSTYLEGRGGKKVDSWCRDKGMALVAGNYYEAEWDDQCDEGHKQLGFAPPAQYQSPSQQAEAAAAAAEAETNEEEVEAAEETNDDPVLPSGLGDDEEVNTPVMDDDDKPSIMLTQDSRDPTAAAAKEKELQKFQAKLGGADLPPSPRQAEEVDRERLPDPNKLPQKYNKDKRDSSLAVSNVEDEKRSRSEELNVARKSGRASKSIELFEQMGSGKGSNKKPAE